MDKMPKINETVTIKLTGVVDALIDRIQCFRLQDETGDNFAWVSPDHIVQTRQPWDVLREAAKLLGPGQQWDLVRTALYEEADFLEEEANPKQTLAEAVRAYLARLESSSALEYREKLENMREALAREEAAKKD